MKLNMLDFFCGAGGMSLGFQDAGFEVLGAYDFDKYAIQTYLTNVGNHAKQCDIKTMTHSDLQKATIWTFGFPCQDLSIAGKQAGLEGARSGLFFEVMRLLDETNEHAPDDIPLIIMAENVKGLKPFLPILEQEYSKRNYTMYVQLLNSKHFNVPQNRERYFVVGVHNSIKTPFSFPTNSPSIPKLSTILDSTVDEKYYMSDEKAQKIIERIKEKGYVQLQDAYVTKDDCAYCCDASYYKGVAPSDVGKCRRTHIIEPMIVDDTFGYGGVRIYDKYSPTLRSQRQGLKTVEPKIEVVGRLVQYRIRKLTPNEYGKLQAFPMERWKQVVSNSQAYKQFGNAVTVNVVKEIALQIKKLLT